MTNKTNPATAKQAPGFQSGDIVLRDGSTVHVRAMRPEDESLLATLFRSLSEDSRWLRFCCAVKDSTLAAEAHREAQVDYTNRFGLIALAGPDEQIVGHAFYTAVGEGHADVAFTIANSHQGRGLASIMLGQLAAIALANGIQIFEADVLSSNHRMLGVFRDSGFHLKVQAEAGQLHVTFPTAINEQAAYKFEHRESIAAVNALKLFFEPRAVAVIGPVVACGAGGTLVELLRDVSISLTPLSREDAIEMIQSLKTYPLLNGFRGAPVCDVRALQEGLLRVSAMVEEIPQIAELDCNPFVVYEHGAVILDARVRVAEVEPPRLLGVR